MHCIPVGWPLHCRFLRVNRGAESTTELDRDKWCVESLRGRLLCAYNCPPSRLNQVRYGAGEFVAISHGENKIVKKTHCIGVGKHDMDVVQAVFRLYMRRRGWAQFPNILQ